jgi:hypothetical protein
VTRCVRHSGGESSCPGQPGVGWWVVIGTGFFKLGVLPLRRGTWLGPGRWVVAGGARCVPGGRAGSEARATPCRFLGGHAVHCF